MNLKGFIKLLFTIVLLQSINQDGAAQHRQHPLDKYNIDPTGNVHGGSINKRDKASQNSQDLKIIYVENAEKLLYGNPCALAATHRRGFEYAIGNCYDVDSASRTKRYWNNFKVKLKIFFRRGPFWKSKLKKEIKKCAIGSGDYRG